MPSGGIMRDFWHAAEKVRRLGAVATRKEQLLARRRVSELAGEGGT
jgi:hypothetical protein